MEEDDADFKPSPNTSSNLASLFGFTKKTPQGNSSFTYTAPKAPKRESSPGKKQFEEKSKGKIIFSKAVQAYKLENRAYDNQGLIGIVISGNHESQIYEIILYKRTKEHLCQIKISTNFLIILSPNNYVSFYDNNKQNWSIMFQSISDVQQFAQKVAICKFYSQPQPSSDILIQDLGPSSQQKTSSNSVIEVVYSIYTLIPEELSKLKGEIKEKIKLSDYDFTYLSKGLTGCAENCKRVIIIPHSLSGPWLNELGPNKDLLIEANVEKIVNELENPVSESNLPREGQPESPIDSSAEEACIKARGVSLKEALGSTKSQKANLISRMARMGQATLPIKQGLSSVQSDSEEENIITSSPKPRLLRNRNTTVNPSVNNLFSQTSQNSGASQQMSVYQSDISWPQAQLGKLGVAYQQLVPVSASPIPSPTADPNLSVYISESRIQATELRMGLSKISEKLELVWDKLQNLSGARTENKTYQQALMDSGGILAGIQNLITENESLKGKVEEQKGKIEQQNDRIYHLLELNHKYLEQSSTTHEKQSANESKFKTEMEWLQKKELEMEAANKGALEKVKNLEVDLAKSNELNKQLKERVDMLTLEADSLKRNLEGSNDEKTKELESFKWKMSKASETVTKLKERLREVISENESLKSLIAAQKEEIESGSKEVKESKTKNTEYEKTVESLKRQISEEESKTETQIENLTKIVAKLEEENKNLLEKIEKEKDREKIDKVLPNILSVLKEEVGKTEECSPSHILRIIENVFNNAIYEIFEIVEEKTENSQPTPVAVEQKIVPTPRTSLQNIEPSPREDEDNEALREETQKKEVSFLEEPEKKQEEAKEAADGQKKKDDTDNRYKSYDQGWRTTKPPPPSLFDEEDDDDYWLN